jgi:hypothetical protein
MLKEKALSFLASSIVLLGGDQFTGPAPTKPTQPPPETIPWTETEEVVHEGVILYQTPEIVIEATNFTYAESATFTYTITNKTVRDMNFKLTNTMYNGQGAGSPLACMLKAGAESVPLTFTQPESTFMRQLEFEITDYDEFDTVLQKTGKIVTLNLKPVDTTLNEADLVYDGQAKVYKVSDKLYLDNPPAMPATQPTDPPEPAVTAPTQPPSTGFNFDVPETPLVTPPSNGVPGLSKI